MRLFILLALLAASCSAFKPKTELEPERPILIGDIQFYDEFRDTAFVVQSDAPGSRLRLENDNAWELLTTFPIEKALPSITRIQGVEYSHQRGRYSSIIHLSPAFMSKDVLTNVMSVVKKLEADTAKPYTIYLPFSKTDSTIAFEVGIIMNDTMSVQMRSDAKVFTVKDTTGDQRVVKFELQIDPNMVTKTMGKDYTWAYLISDGTSCSSPDYGVSLCFQKHVLNFAPDGSATIDGRLMYRSFPVYISMIEWASTQKLW